MEHRRWTVSIIRGKWPVEQAGGGTIQADPGILERKRKIAAKFDHRAVPPAYNNYSDIPSLSIPISHSSFLFSRSGLRVLQGESVPGGVLADVPAGSTRGTPTMICAGFTKPSPVAGSFDFGHIDFAHLHHRRKSPFGLVTASSHGIGQDPRGDLPGNSPAVPAPATFTFLAAIPDNRVLITVGFLLGVRRHLKRKSLTVLEGGPAIQPDAWQAHHRELNRDHLALLSRRIIAGSQMNARDFAVRKSGRIKTRGLFGVLVEPQADDVFGFLELEK